MGVAAIAFGVLDKYDRNVPIIPIGLNYFRGHRFRGRVVVQFGEPISITQDTIAVYKGSKRAGYQKLLAQVEEGMRSVIVTAPDYGELKLVHTTRRLFQKTPSAMKPSNPTKYRQEMARRFAVAFQLLKDKYNGEANLPEEVLALKERILDYQDTLDNWGLYDYQVNQLQLDMPFNTLLYTFVHALLVITLAGIPSIFLNAPVGLAASWYASNEAKKDLEASRVKLYGRDVLMSKKILFSLVAVPVLWVTYAVLLCLFTNWERRTIFVLFLCFPIFAYIGVTGLGQGMVDMKDLRPAFLRLMPGFRAVVKQLPKQRLALQKDVRSLVRKYGPELGSVYEDHSEVWEKKVDLTSAAHAGGRKEADGEAHVDNDNTASGQEGGAEDSRPPVAPRGRVMSDMDSSYNFTTGISCSLPQEGEVPRVDSNQDIVGTAEEDCKKDN